MSSTPPRRGGTPARRGRTPAGDRRSALEIILGIPVPYSSPGGGEPAPVISAPPQSQVSNLPPRNLNFQSHHLLPWNLHVPVHPRLPLHHPALARSDSNAPLHPAHIPLHIHPTLPPLLLNNPPLYYESNPHAPLPSDIHSTLPLNNPPLYSESNLHASLSPLHASVPLHIHSTLPLNNPPLYSESYPGPVYDATPLRIRPPLPTHSDEPKTTKRRKISGASSSAAGEFGSAGSGSSGAYGSAGSKSSGAFGYAGAFTSAGYAGAFGAYGSAGSGSAGSGSTGAFTSVGASGSAGIGGSAGSGSAVIGGSAGGREMTSTLPVHLTIQKGKNDNEIKPLRVKHWDKALLEYTLAMPIDSSSKSKLPLSKRLAEISCPVLIITGDYDRIVPSWNAKRLSQAIPGSCFEVIKNCGHLPHEERVEEFLSVVDRFLQRVFGAPEEQLLQATA